MGTLAVLSIFLYISVTIATAADSNHKTLKQNPFDTYRPRKEDESDESGAADDEPRRDWRVLQSGDVLTPPELLPLAKRLRSKVDTRQPGEGKGIVSGSKSAEALADVLFRNFFMIDRGISTLSKYDIAGLDALQALALDGNDIHQNLKLVSVNGARCYVDELVKNGEVDNNMCYFSGPEPRKSIYTLLTKPLKSDSIDENSIPNIRKKGEADIPQSRINLMKHLQKNRKIVVNTGRKNNENKKKESMKPREIKGGNIKTNNEPLNVATSRPIIDGMVNKQARLKGCRWRFQCLNPRDLDTCRLKTLCPGQVEVRRNGISDEQHKLQQRVRRMIGISSVDEDVEKILEARALRIRPNSFKKHISSVPDESLTQYFSHLLLRQGAEKNKQGETQKKNKYLVQ